MNAIKRENGKWYIKIGDHWVDIFTPDFRKAHDEIEYRLLKTNGLHLACSTAWCANGGCK